MLNFQLAYCDFLLHQQYMVELAKSANTHLPREPVPPLSATFPTWAKIAALSFGGPAGQIAVMHRILVDEKRWIDDARFMHALSFCMVLPGPEAMQLATYCGWMMHGVRGGLLAGALFVLPGVLAIMALSILYVTLGDAGWLTGLFFGLKAAVLAIVIGALIRIGGKALYSNAAKFIAVAAFLALALFAVPFPIVVLVAAVVGWYQMRHPRDVQFGADKGHSRVLANTFRVSAILVLLWAGTMLALYTGTGSTSVWTEIGKFFSLLAVVTFGGAYAVLAYVGQVAVTTKHWLLPGEMLDGLGMAETTPGPLVMVLQFVGFLAAYRNPGGLDPMLAGVLGGLLTSWVTFLPCFLWVFAGAPYIERLRSNKAVSAALAGVTAAVVGVIANLALWFALHFLFVDVQRIHMSVLQLEWPVWSSLNIWALILSLLAAVLLLRFNLGLFKVLGICVVAGVAVILAGG
jgi:chromate transporter